MNLKKKILLPRPFYFVGIAIALLVVTGAILLRYLESPLYEDPETVAKYVFAIVGTGLLLSMISREKIEDERIDNIRRRAYKQTFLFGALFVAWASFVPMDGTEWLQNSGGMIVFLQATYLSKFYQLKRKDQ